MPECVCNEVTNANKGALYLYIAAEKFHAQTFDLIGVTTTKIYCPATAFRTCVLALPRTIKLGLTMVGNQAKPLKFSEKKL
jgi:hypothetical protein